MRKRWKNEAVEFVRHDPRFKLLAKEHGKAKAARVRIAEMMTEEAEQRGDLEGAAYSWSDQGDRGYHRRPATAAQHHVICQSYEASG